MNGVDPEKEKSWEQFGMCQLKSTANSAQFRSNQAGLAVLFGRQILDGFHHFILFILLGYYRSLELKTIENYLYTLALLSLII